MKKKTTTKSNHKITHPIYIISKGRADRQLTAKALLAEDIDFRVVVEAEEADAYREHVGDDKVLVLPFSNLGKGSYPARNFCWEHAAQNGHDWHWLFDDNIYCFTRLNKGKRKRTSARLALHTLEAFADRYENLGIIGFNYRYFVTKETKKPFVVNTHVYSGMLIRNDMKYRWRLRFNEDVDLCLQILHDGKLCTVLVNAFLIDKVSTTTKMKGGNQAELYKNNDPKQKFKKSESLRRVWPQYVRVVERFNRIHHQVSWNKFFRHKLIRKS